MCRDTDQGPLINTVRTPADEDCLGSKSVEIAKYSTGPNDNMVMWLSSQPERCVLESVDVLVSSYHDQFFVILELWICIFEHPLKAQKGQIYAILTHC